MGNREDSNGGASRVWVVDDSPLQGEICRTALAASYHVDVFNHGSTILEALGERAAPDVLVLDWHMPDLPGIEVCRFVREVRHGGDLPILILTASRDEESLVEAFAAGANDFVVKPFSTTELNARVSALVRHKQLHSKLAEVERRLLVEAEFRERFMAMLAHDLRQPLNTFILANQTLAKDLPTESWRLLDMQRRAADRMSRMVTELLDFTRNRPETGMPVEYQTMDFESVVRAVLDEVRVGHPARTFTLSVRGSCSGYWDQDRLAQVCSNLIGNAIEHSIDEASPIELQLEQVDHQVKFSVSNRSKPIPSEMLPTLFDAFRRGRDAPRPTGGVGLGLHIVREIVRAHDGSITAASDSGATVFEVTLPTGSPDRSAPLERRAQARYQ